jgi:hypothetical protein
MSKPISIIAFDPGEMTGYATGTVEDGVLRTTSYGYDPWKVVLLRFMRHMLDKAPRYDHVVYESWRLRPDKAREVIGSDMQSSQFIGGMKATVWWCQTALAKAIQLHTNEPGNKPSIDGWMAAAGNPNYLPKADKDHPKDAVRHLYYHAVYRLKVKEEDCYGISED